VLSLVLSEKKYLRFRGEVQPSKTAGRSKSNAIHPSTLLIMLYSINHHMLVMIVAIHFLQFVYFCICNCVSICSIFKILCKFI